MRNNFNKGFTLVEILAVVAILATIVTATVAVMNPIEMLQQAEDAVRLNDINSIHQVLTLFRSQRPGGSIGEPNIVYVSIPSASSTCVGAGLPALPTGWEYRCVTAANLRNINGTGWIPVNFAAIPGRIPFTILPIDPVNTAASGSYYAFVTDRRSWALATMTRSRRHSAASIGDGGTDAARFEVGTNLSLWASASVCPHPTVTFTYRGASVTYGTVVSTGRCWLDRNLGATRVATAFNDTQAYGDLFQWGRLSDNHQDRGSGITTALSGSNVPGHGLFITTGYPPGNWRSPENNALWQGVAGVNNPCPSGWRIPTEAEWTIERNSWSAQNTTGAFNSPLRLVAGGSRSWWQGAFDLVGTTGFYWSSSFSGIYGIWMQVGSTSAGTGPTQRARASSIRCILN